MIEIVLAVNEKVRDVAKDLPNKGAGDIDALLPLILNLVYTAAGLLAIGYIIYAGYTFVRSEGDHGQVAKARQAIFWAMAGLFMVILAAVITNFVIFGVDQWIK